jgi:hypothetical protein
MASRDENRTCPVCEQIVPRDVPHVKYKGKYIHADEAREIARIILNKEYVVHPKDKKRKDDRKKS